MVSCDPCCKGTKAQRNGREDLAGCTQKLKVALFIWKPRGHDKVDYLVENVLHQKIIPLSKAFAKVTAGFCFQMQV